jgi:hypothetical protein
MTNCSPACALRTGRMVGLIWQIRGWNPSATYSEAASGRPFRFRGHVSGEPPVDAEGVRRPGARLVFPANAGWRGGYGNPSRPPNELPGHRFPKKGARWPDGLALDLRPARLNVLGGRQRLARLVSRPCESRQRLGIRVGPTNASSSSSRTPRASEHPLLEHSNNNPQRREGPSHPSDVEKPLLTHGKRR